MPYTSFFSWYAGLCWYSLEELMSVSCGTCFVEGKWSFVVVRVFDFLDLHIVVHSIGVD